MSSFDTHVHIDEFAADATPAEMAELNAWVHEEMIAAEADQAADPSGGCDESDEGCADFDEEYFPEYFDYPQEDDLYGCDPGDSGGW